MGNKIEVNNTEYIIKENNNVDDLKSIVVKNTETHREEVFNLDGETVEVYKDRVESSVPGDMVKVLDKSKYKLDKND